MHNILNKRKSRYCFTWVMMWMLLGLGHLNAMAQETGGTANITGKVIDQYGNPVSEVVVTMKNADFKAVTGIDGTFEFQYKKGDALRFSHPGFLYKEIKVNKLKNSERIFKVTLSEEFVKSRDVMNGPYSTKDKDSFLGSAATIYTDQVNSMLATTIIPSLQGRLPGLNITQTRGARKNQIEASSSQAIMTHAPNLGKGVYSDNTEFDIRTRHKDYAPVVVVDGIQRDLYSLDPDAIESVSLQKDALSSMFLGMRSSRGALVITTKEPIKEGFQLSFTGRFGVQSTVKDLNPLPADQYAYLLNEALLNDNKKPFYSYDDYTKYRDNSSPYTHPNVNWQDELMNNSSTIQSYNLNATGGNKFAQYFVSVGYVGENGLFKNPGGDAHDTNMTFDRYMISSKVNVNITDDFSAKISLMGRIEEGTQPGGKGTGFGDILSAIYDTPNNAYPVRNPDGSWGGSQSFTNNLLSMAINSGYITDGARDVLGSINLRYNFDKVVKGLSARMVGSITSQNRSTTNRSKSSETFDYIIDAAGNESYTRFGEPKPQSNAFNSVTTYQQMYGQFAVDYQRQFGEHGLTASLSADTRTTLSNWDLPEYPSNIIADVSYNYGGRYFAQAAMSQSYYNRYAPGRRWATFYAFGLGWDISKESFMEDLDWLNQFKIRGVFGNTGNGMDNAGYYTYSQTYSSGGDGYQLGTNFGSGPGYYEKDPLANPFLTWEKAEKFNIGVDLALFNNKLRITGDYYNDKYSDLLQKRGKSIELIGQDYPNENIGKTRWYGGELSVTYQDRIGKFNYYVSGNWSCEQSKLLFKDEQAVPHDYLRETGNSVRAIYGLVADGFFTSQEEIKNSPVIEGFDNIQPGDIKYKDLNNDKVINEFDKKLIGGDKPLSYFGIDLGFQWQGLEFSMFWQGVYNKDVLMGDWNLLEGFQQKGQVYGQAYENMLDRWTPETANTATFPRLSAGSNKYNKGNDWNSSFWVRSGNYIRLKNISLGYNLPDSFCRNYLGGTRVKIFVNGQNLFTKAANELVDPEVSFGNYPLQRCVSTGINVKF